MAFVEELVASSVANGVKQLISNTLFFAITDCGATVSTSTTTCFSDTHPFFTLLKRSVYVPTLLTKATSSFAPLITTPAGPLQLLCTFDKLMSNEGLPSRATSCCLHDNVSRSLPTAIRGYCWSSNTTTVSVRTQPVFVFVTFNS